MAGRGRQQRAQDLYALGATLHQLLSHRTPGAELPPIGRLRRGVPVAVRRLIGDLLSEDVRRRPSARAAAAVLRRAAPSAAPRHLLRATA